MTYLYNTCKPVYHLASVQSQQRQSSSQSLETFGRISWAGRVNDTALTRHVKDATPKGEKLIFTSGLGLVLELHRWVTGWFWVSVTWHLCNCRFFSERSTWSDEVTSAVKQLDAGRQPDRPPIHCPFCACNQLLPPSISLLQGQASCQ